MDLSKSIRRLSFVELMSLEQLQSENPDDVTLARFMGCNPSPSLGSSSGYGGYVYAQSVWAASQTVKEGMVVHNVHGYFTLPALVDRPLIYEVQVLSTGRSFCTRLVTARQPLSPCSFPYQSSICVQSLGKICFACICSFKKDEIAPSQHQLRAELKRKYESVWKNDPSEHEVAPLIDTPWWREFTRTMRKPRVDNLPGLDVRKVDMSIFNNNKQPEDWRQLSYYRCLGEVPLDLPNLHACAHLYASDRNSLFLISNAVGFGDEIGSMGSLSHSVVFHVKSDELLMKGEDWWCQEAWTSRSEGGRGMHESHIWNKDEVMIASTWQEGQVRKADGGNAQRQRAAWIDMMKRAGGINTKVAIDLKASKL